MEIVLLLVLGLPFVTILLASYASHRREKLVFAERQLMIEKGLTSLPPVPTGFWEKAPAADTVAALEACLRRGIVLVIVGLGLAIASRTTSSGSALRDVLIDLSGFAGFIVGAVGIGNLVYYGLARRRVREEALRLPKGDSR